MCSSISVKRQCSTRRASNAVDQVSKVRVSKVRVAWLSQVVRSTCFDVDGSRISSLVGLSVLCTSDDWVLASEGRESGERMVQDAG